MKSDISVTLGADLVNFKRAMDQAQALVRTAMANIKKMILSVAAVLGVAFGLREVAQGIGAVVDRGKDLDTLSRSTGLAADEIVRLQQALFRSGATMQDAAAVMVELRDRMYLASFGADNLGNVLHRMGLDVAAIQRMALPDQFVAIAEAINRVGDPLQRARLSAEIFGESAKEIVAAFQSGDMEEALRLMGGSGKALAGSAKLLAMIADAWRMIKTAGDQFFTGLATKLAPAFNAVTTLVKEWLPRFYEVGAKIGEVLIAAFHAAIGLWQSGQIIEFLKLGFIVAVKTLVNYGVRAAKVIAETVGRGFLVAMRLLADPNFLSGLGLALAGIGQLLIDAFKQAAAILANKNLYAAIWAGMKYAMSPLADGIAKFINKMRVAYLEWQRNNLMTKEGVGEGVAKVQKYQAMNKAKQRGPEYDQARKDAQEALQDANVRSAVRLGDEIAAMLDQSSDVASTAEADMHAAFDRLIDSAGSDTGAITRRAAEIARQAVAEFAKVDMSGFADLLKKIPEMWGKTAEEVLSSAEDMQRLVEIVAKAKAAGEEWAKSVGAVPGAAPGAGGAGRAQGGFQNTLFDAFRRVGGGLAGGAQDIARKSYERLGEINRNIIRLGEVVKGVRRMGESPTEGALY